MESKRLLILGGSRYLKPVIKEAHKLGIYVITCDYLPDNYAHSISDEYVNVSIIDKEAVLEKAKELNIDGVMSFACDPGVTTAAYVAEKLNLPSVGSYESVCILQNKGRFRKFLTDNGFNVPVAKSYNNIDDAIKDVDIFNWPVIVKPTDSAGSKGVTRIDNKEDLKQSIEHALSFSHCNEFIIEDFLQQKGFSSDCDSFSIDGKMVVTNFASQWFDKNADNPYTPSAMTWPSSICENNQKELTNEIQRLITLLNLETSIYNIETRECINGKTYIMELSPRGGGNRLAEMCEYIYGTNMIENAVRAAVGLELVEMKKEESKSYWGEIVLHSKKDGVFNSLEIDESIVDNVVENDLWVEPGDKVYGFTGANQTIGTLIVKFDNEEDLYDLMNNQDKYIKVICE